MLKKYVTKQPEKVQDSPGFIFVYQVPLATWCLSELLKWSQESPGVGHEPHTSPPHSWHQISFTSLAGTQMLLQIHSFQFQLVQLLLDVTNLLLDFLLREVVWVQLGKKM